MESQSIEPSSTLQMISNSLSDIVSEISNSVVAIQNPSRFVGSGVIWRDNIVVTAAHLLKQEKEVVLIYPDGNSYPAELVGIDPGIDLAVLKTAAQTLAVPSIRSENHLKPGQLVTAVGRGGDASIGACWGIVSNVSGEWQSWSGSTVEHYIELDMRLSRGFSGSPLVSVDGEVLGIVTSGFNHRKTLTIPSITINRMLGPLMEKGRISRGFMGVGLYPVRLPEKISSSLTPSRKAGVVIVGMNDGGPADTSGLIVGDILLSIDGKSVSDIRDVRRALRPETVGREVPVHILRAGISEEFQVTIGEHPKRSP